MSPSWSFWKRCWLHLHKATTGTGLHSFSCVCLMYYPVNRDAVRLSTEAGAPACHINMQWHDLPLDLVLEDIIENAHCYLSARPLTNNWGSSCEWQYFVFSLKGLGSTTSITVDFGDGTAISYVNISSIEDGVKHIYGKVGIYQVSATASNTLGFDRVILYLHISCESETVI